MKFFKLFSLLTFIILFYVSCTLGGNPKNAVIPDKIETLNKVGLENLLKENKGKIIIVDMWATWCPPCKLEIPTFIDIENDFKNEVLLITLCHKQDNNGKELTEENLKKFMKERGINYKVYFIDNEFFKDPLFARDKGGYAFPTTLFYDKSGNLAEKHIGYGMKWYFYKIINKLKKR